MDCSRYHPLLTIDTRHEVASRAPTVAGSKGIHRQSAVELTGLLKYVHGIVSETSITGDRPEDGGSRSKTLLSQRQFLSENFFPLKPPDPFAV